MNDIMAVLVDFRVVMASSRGQSTSDRYRRIRCGPWASGGDRGAPHANADANNSSGQPWSGVDQAGGRTGAEQESWTNLNLSGQVSFDS